VDWPKAKLCIPAEQVFIWCKPVLTEENQRRYGFVAGGSLAGPKSKVALPDDYEAEVAEPVREAVVQQVARRCSFLFRAPASTTRWYLCWYLGAAHLGNPGLLTWVRGKNGTPRLVANPFAERGCLARGSKMRRRLS